MRKQEAPILVRETAGVFRVLASPVCLRIYFLLKAAGPLTADEIEAAMKVPDVSRSSVAKALGLMAKRTPLARYRSGPPKGTYLMGENRLVEVTGPRRNRRYSASAEGARLIELALRHVARAWPC